MYDDCWYKDERVEEILEQRGRERAEPDRIDQMDIEVHAGNPCLWLVWAGSGDRRLVGMMTRSDLARRAAEEFAKFRLKAGFDKASRRWDDEYKCEMFYANECDELITVERVALNYAMKDGKYQRY